MVPPDQIGLTLKQGLLFHSRDLSYIQNRGGREKGVGLDGASNVSMVGLSSIVHPMPKEGILLVFL